MDARGTSGRWMACVAAWIASAFSAALMAGCAGGDRDVTASAVRDPVFYDIPKPAGFKLVEERSVARVSGRVRVAKCEYKGSTDVAAVKRFYEEYLPSAGFEQRRASLDEGTYILSFESAAEMCDVSIRRKSFSTVVVIEIGPKSSGVVDRDAPPPVRRPAN